MSEYRMMVIQLGSILVHDLVRGLHRMVMTILGRRLICSISGRRVYKQVQDLTLSRRPLVDGKSCGKLLVTSSEDGVEQEVDEPLAVVGDEVISRLHMSDVVDCHLGCPTV